MKREIKFTVYWFEKPETKYSTRPKWQVYLSSYYLQTLAFVISLFTRKPATHAFFYSKKQDAIGASMFITSQYSKSKSPRFRGRAYSEMSELKHGWNNWNDSKLIGIGSNADIN